MAKVLDPLPDAELADPQMERLEHKARKECWKVGWYRLKAAELMREAHHCKGCASVWSGGPIVPMDEVLQKAFLAEVSRQMLIPAPDAAALRWKLRLKGAGVPYGTTDARREAAIAADEARLQ